MSGRLIAFEGIAGSGKSTLARRTAHWLRDQGLVVLETKEPGGTLTGTPAGVALRGVLLDHARYPDLPPLAQVLGFELDRAITTLTLVAPALARDQWVIADRHHFGTFAYQGHGAGMDLALIDLLSEAAIGGRFPDLSLVLDLPLTLARQRQRDASAMDRFDALGTDYHARVAEGYRIAARRRPTAAVIIDASGELETVYELIQEAIGPLLPTG